ncbi:MAG: diguanylate cyclase [Candidatus Dormiibacterota bacterium]
MVQNSGFYRDIIESSTAAVVVVGADAAVRYHTPEAGRLLAGSTADLVGMLFPALFAPGAQDSVDSFLRRVTGAGADESISMEAACLIRDGDERTIEMTAMNLLESSEVGGVVINLVDRTELRRALDLAEREARFDPLTGLFNRRSFDEHGQALFSSPGARRWLVALFDMDNLKPINDAYGHQVGDQVLRCAAERLSTVLGSFGPVARLGGNEFAALLPDIDAAKARHLLEAACRAISMPLDGIDLVVTATCGVASSTMAKHWPGLLHRTDAALYEAKSTKRGGVYFYRGDEPGWDQRRWREREARLAAEKTVVALKSDVVRLEQETRHDQRTALLNAAAFEEDFQALHALAGRLGETYSIVLCDIDFFHKYNARYLYQPANVTLRTIADAIRTACRPGDDVYRYGGEEVIITLRRTGLSDAGHVAERVRSAVAELAIPHENRPDPHIVTISVGVAECDPSAGLTGAAVVDAANRALIVAKQSGRNRVAIGDAKPSS